MSTSATEVLWHWANNGWLLLLREVIAKSHDSTWAPFVHLSFVACQGKLLKVTSVLLARAGASRLVVTLAGDFVEL